MYITLKRNKYGGIQMRMLIGTAANFVSGYYIGRNFGLLGTLLGWAFLLGGGYLLIENWDNITVWMHSLNIVRGLDGYEDMSNGFIFICLVLTLPRLKPQAD